MLSAVGRVFFPMERSSASRKKVRFFFGVLLVEGDPCLTFFGGFFPLLFPGSIVVGGPEDSAVLS